jgi:dethiobiotin synthetase
MTRGLFISGTDTGIGKTVVAAALMHRYRNELKLRYWKPIQTGIEQDNDTEVVRALGHCSKDEILDDGVRLKRPLSPHLAAKLSGTRITVDQIHRTLRAHADQRVSWIIEGAGGVLVPINESEQMVHLAEALRLPVLVVVSTKLGTINHTLLTVEALRRRALIIAGVVMVGDRDTDNREAIEAYGAVSVLGEMPTFAPLDSNSVRGWALSEFDTKSVLLDHLCVAHHARQSFTL